MTGKARNTWRIALGLSAAVALTACTQKVADVGAKSSQAPAQGTGTVVTGDGSFAPDGDKYAVSVVSGPTADTKPLPGSYLGRPEQADAGDELVKLTLRITNAGNQSEPYPINPAGLAPVPFRIAIPSSTHDSVAPDAKWTISWSCGNTDCSSPLLLSDTDPAHSQLDFMGSDRPLLETNGSVTMVLYVEVPAGFESHLNEVRLFWYGVAGTGTQTEIPLSGS